MGFPKVYPFGIIRVLVFYNDTLPDEPETLTFILQTASNDTHSEYSLKNPIVSENLTRFACVVKCNVKPHQFLVDMQCFNLYNLLENDILLEMIRHFLTVRIGDDEHAGGTL